MKKTKQKYFIELRPKTWKDIQKLEKFFFGEISFPKSVKKS